MLTATAETGAGAGEVAEGDPAASSDSHSSNSTSSRISSSSSNSTSRGDVPTLVGREAHRQKWDGKIPALQGGRTRSQSRQHQMLTVVPEICLTEGPGEYVVVLLSRRYILYTDVSFPE